MECQCLAAGLELPGSLSSLFFCPPSAPQNLVYNINQTTVGLEWSPPADTGGRNDVTYRIICRRCGWEPEECAACGGNVGYYPQQAGLADTYVTVVDLVAHANYTFEVEAVNGVSDMSRTQRLFAAVTIATGQAERSLNYPVTSPSAAGTVVATRDEVPSSSVDARPLGGAAGVAGGSDVVPLFARTLVLVVLVEAVEVVVMAVVLVLVLLVVVLVLVVEVVGE
ncbi:hypothetical protein CRUP_029150 [Coryphaenoides rupestris]|nr:hypothetical protein CRUP_029150 [Coryphaenoides rupestris]